MKPHTHSHPASVIRRIVSTAILIAGAICAAPGAEVPKEGLIAAWEFNDPSGGSWAAPELGTGTVEFEGLATFSAAGQGQSGQANDHALSFGIDGDAAAWVRSPEFFQALNSASANDTITVVWWQKGLAPFEDHTSFRFGAADATLESPGPAHAAFHKNSHDFIWETDGRWLTRDWLYLGGEFEWQEWNHFACVKNGPVKQVWVNGALFHETADAPALGMAMESLRLGGPGQYSGVLRGMIDDLGVFGVALSQEEIRSLAYRLSPLAQAAYTEPPPIARPPLLTILSPLDGAAFHPLDGGIRFRVATWSPKAIARNAIRLFLNDQDVSGRILVSGSERSWTIHHVDRLQPNQLYTVRAIVTDDTGLQTTRSWRFDTVDGRLTLVSAETHGNASGLSITFSGPVNPASATNAANYGIDRGVTVHSVSLVSAHQVLLHTAPIAEGQVYTVTINGVAGTDAAPGLIPPNTQRRFVQSQGVLTRREFHDISGALVSDLTNHARFPNAPDSAGYAFDFEAPANVRENYGVQLAGYLIPPVSGDYVFFICSDDEGVLFLSTDDSPANKRLIAHEPAWNSPRFWHNAVNQDSRSFTIHTPFVEGALFIEAEDFDFDGGQFVADSPIGMDGPYTGGVYEGRGTLADQAIDWRTRKAVESPAYRAGVQMHLIDITGLGENLSRGAFSVTSSHAMHWDGWHDGTDFLNFTRDFPLPAWDYYVLARVSSGAWQIDSTLSEVTAGVGTADQTTAHLGRFVTPSNTGGWDQYVFVPMRDALGNYKRVRLGGPHTLRYTKSEGGSQDFDYLVFTPAGPAGEEIPKNMSRPITLVAGRKYYIEALMKEAGGGDNLAVAWQMPGGPAPANGLDVLPGAFLSSLEPSGPVTIVAAPENLNVSEHQTAVFRVDAAGSPPLGYQWRTNGVPLLGGTNATLTLADVPASWDGLEVSVEVANAFSSAVSAGAELKVTPDLTAPVVQSVQAGLNWLHVTFSKPLQRETATNVANYQVTGEVQVLSATLAPDGKTVLLTTTPQASRSEYSLSVKNVRDTSSSDPPVPDVPFAYTAVPHPISLDPESFSAGYNYPANSLSSDWENCPGRIERPDQEWNQLTPQPINYFMPEEVNRLVIKSRVVSRDQEVDTWFPHGLVYLRLTEEGKAVSFTYSALGNEGRGQLVVGLSTGITDQNVWPPVHNFATVFYQNNDLAGSVPGYPQPAQRADRGYLTFGVHGFDLYVKFNGQEIWRGRQFLHLAEGKAAIGVAGHQLLSRTTFRALPEMPVLSDYRNRRLDLRDFGLKAILTTGNIAEGSRTLSLDSAPDPRLQPGDYIILELGGETGQGRRGTMGVGGSWPSLNYQDAAAMAADLSQPAGTHAWMRDNGEVRRWNGATWEDASRWTNSVGTAYYQYYYAEAIPRALRARIEAVSTDGRNLTLSAAASTSSAGARVHYDNAFALNYVALCPSLSEAPSISPTEMELHLPAGDYAIGEPLAFVGHPGWKLIGQGRDKTRIFSPAGVSSASLTLSYSPGAEVCDLHLQGNARNSGFGLRYPSLIFTGGGLDYRWVDDINRPPTVGGIVFAQSTGGVGKRLRVTDAFPAALQSVAQDVWFEDCDVIASEGVRDYIGWYIQFADATGGGVRRCTFYSPELAPAWEPFKSYGTIFENCVSTNGVMAMNASGGFVVRDFDFLFTPNSYPAHWDPNVLWMAVNINNNTFFDAYLHLGGLLDNVNILQTGSINATNSHVYGIAIQQPNPNITIRGGTYTAPDYTGFSNPVAINSGGLNTVVDGFVAAGLVRGEGYLDHTLYGSGSGNINVADGVVRNTLADFIKLGPAAVAQNSRPFRTIPALQAVPEQTLREGEELVVQLAPAESKTSGKLQFFLAGAPPEGAALDPITGRFSWRPNGQQGSREHSIAVGIRDSSVPRLESIDFFRVIVEEGNTPPLLGVWGWKTNSLLENSVDFGSNADPLVLGATEKVGEGRYRIVGHGSGFGGSYYSTDTLDHGHFAWTDVTGDFDIRVRMTDLVSKQRAAYAGLHLRETSDAGSRFVQLVVAPDQESEPGDYAHSVRRRYGTAASITDWISFPDRRKVPFPNTWLRIMREGALFTFYGSADGVNWVQLSYTIEPDFSNRLLAGVCAASHFPSAEMAAEASFDQLQIITRALVSPTEVVTIKAGQTLDLTNLDATDIDLPEQVLTFSLGPDSPQGAAIDSFTGRLTWTPNGAQASGPHTINVRVTDDGEPPLFAEQTLIVHVDPNLPPVLAEIPNQSATEGQPFRLVPSAQDPDAPSNDLRWSLGTEAPEGMSIDPISGAISWTPGEQYGGLTESMTITVTDDGVPPMNHSQTFSIAILELNSPPTLAPIPNATIDVGQTLEFTLSATDPDLPSNVLTFTLGPGAPAGAILTAAGAFRWTPSVAQANGTYPIEVIVTDDGSPPLRNTTSFQATVRPILQDIRLASVSLHADGRLWFSWAAQPGVSYRVQFKGSLTDPDWIDLEPAIKAGANASTYSTTIGASPQGFYRVLHSSQ